MFLQAFEFEQRIQNPNLQVDSVLKTSFAKQKAFNRAAIGHVIDTLKFIGELGIPFRGHRDSGRVEPVTEIKDIDTSTGNYRAILQLHAMGKVFKRISFECYMFKSRYSKRIDRNYWRRNFINYFF